MPIIDNAIDDPLRNRQQALIIQAMDAAVPLTALGPYLGPFLGGWNLLANGGQPQFPLMWAVVGSVNYRLYIFTGLRTVQAAQSLCASWLSTQNTYTNSPFPQFVVNTGDDILGVPGANPANYAGKIVCIGHSFGGCVAQAIALGLKLSNPNATVQVATYGSPKCVGQAAYLPLSNITNIRWAAEGDQVPIYPPNIFRAPTLHGILPRAASTRLMGWTAIGAPATIDNNATVDIRGTDFTSAAIGISTLLGIWNSQAGALGPAHSIDNYVTLMNAAYTAQLVPKPPVVPDQVPVPAPPVVPASAIAAADAARDAFVAGAQAQDAISPVLPKGFRFSYYKVSPNFWMTTLGGTEICAAPSKRKAAAIARHGNRMLALYQGVGSCYRQSFVMALSSYLLAASDANNGFRPPLAIAV